ncbi:MAG: ComEC/Rec2 family competence protein [Actinomycetota bacterium]|nr:ComEC/Rec2 family competence protein [Actinomycetota bacterium]
MRDPIARVWTAALFFVAGAAAASLLPTRLAVLGCLVGATGTFLRRRRLVAVLALAVLSFAAGSLDASLHNASGAALETLAHGSPRCLLHGRVQEAMSPFGSLVRVGEIACADGVVSGGALALPLLTAPAGTRVDGSGWLIKPPQGMFEDVLRRNGASAAFQTSNLTTSGISSPVFRLAAAIRGSLAAASSRLSPPESALLKGVAIGDTSDFDSRTLEDFRRSGLSHLLAVSGENLAMLMGAVAFAATRLARKPRIFVMALAAGTFVIVVGPQPSVLRAAVMAAIALGAMAAGRSADPLTALGIAIVTVVALRPGLVFSPGLQLSAAATAGIVIWTSRIAARLSALPRPLALGLAATTAAQIAVAPLLVGLFGQISVIGVVANLIALPAVPAATVLGLTAGTVGLFNASAAAVLAVVARPFVAWILWVAARLGRPTWAAVAVPHWAGIPVAALVVMWLLAGLRDPREPSPLSLSHVQLERRGSERHRDLDI